MRPPAIIAARRPDLVRAKGVARPPVPIPNTGPVDTELYRQIFGGTTSVAAGVALTESNIGGLPALDRGVSMVANAVAAMMTEANVIDSATRLPIGARPNIVARPATLLGSFEFWQQAAATVLKRGNYVGVLADLGPDGYAQQVVPIHPDLVQLDNSYGIPIYRIGALQLSHSEVVHVRAHAPTGSFWGLGIVERFRRHLSMQLHEAEYARSGYASGGVPSLVVQLDVNEPTQDQVDLVRQGFIDNHGGAQRTPAVVGNRFKQLTPIGWSPKDVEYVAGAQLSIAQCAYMCGLRPEDLGAQAGGGSGLTYGNRTDDALQRITDSYGPTLRLFEEAWSDLLPLGLEVRGNVEALLRTSTRERLEIREIAQRLGIETPAESRQLEGRA